MNAIKLAFAVLLISMGIAQAADNTVILTPGSGVTMRTKDVGSGVESPLNILGDTSGNAIYGTAGTANANVVTVQGIASGTAQPVSGTFFQATQPVSGTFWQATQPVSGTFFQATQPVSAAVSTFALGSFVDGSIATIGTEADAAYAGSGSTTLIGALKGLYALTNASLLPSAPLTPGTPPTQAAAVLCYNGGTPTVNGSQSVALQCNSAGQLQTTAGAVAQGSTTSGQTGSLVQGAVTTSPPSYTTAQTSPLSLDTAGNLRVNVVAGAAGNAAASTTGAAVPSAADYLGVKVGSNIVGQTGTTVSSTTGADVNVALVAGAAIATGHGTASGSQRVELPTDGTGQVAISQTTPGTTNGVSPVLTTAGGWTPINVAALTNTAVAIKASAGQLGMLYCYNPNATVAYIQVYNTAAGGVTVGTTPNVLPVGIAPTSNGGFPMNFPGIQFSTAITVAATTTAGGAGALSTPVDCAAAYN